MLLKKEQLAEFARPRPVLPGVGLRDALTDPASSAFNPKVSGVLSVLLLIS